MHHVWVNRPPGKGYIDVIDVVVNIKSKKQNNWSGLGKNLPVPLNSIPDNKANPGKYLLSITFDSSGNPTKASLIAIDSVSGWKSDSKIQ